MGRDRKAGFTLAEVLITLGIIGVVAALTLPALINNIKAAEISNRLKKMMSTMNNGAKLAKANYDIDFSNINAYCNANSANDNPNERHSACAIMNGVLSNAKYYYGTNNLTMVDGKPYKFTGYQANISSMKDFSKNPTYVLSDGSIIMFSTWLGQKPCAGNDIESATLNANGTRNGCYGIIDVNGVKGPNKEVTCTSGTYNYYTNEIGNCIVDKNNIVDVYPFALYGDRVELMSNAAAYVMWKW
ncbi:type II secretion system protein [bacterium]|nr:type II secretion system protein [bacterium]